MSSKRRTSFDRGSKRSWLWRSLTPTLNARSAFRMGHPAPGWLVEIVDSHPKRKKRV